MDARKELGRMAERAAFKALKRAGYKILARNRKTRRGELDAVCFEEGQVVFVEIRSRSGSSAGGAIEAFGPRKRRRVVRAAAEYMSEKRIEDESVRFDVVAVDASTEPPVCEIVRDAFRPERGQFA